MEREDTIDLESGVGFTTTNEEDGSTDSVPRARQVQNLLGRVWSGVVSSDGLVKGEDGNNTSFHVMGSMENSGLIADKKSGDEETEGEKSAKEKRKKISPKRPPKPPRPPRGPSLDAADQKLIKEISELIMLKRAKNERMKAMKKMKAAKGSSSNNAGLFAMIITLVFCILFILFPGRSSSHVNFNGSPEPSLATSGGLISVQYYKNISADGAGSSSPSYIEQVSGSRTQREQEALQDDMGYPRKRIGISIAG